MPVLALHGAPASRLMFDVADGAARELGLTLYCPERPGYGLTPAEEGETLRSRAADLERIADHLGLDRFAVLGISGGAPYAVALSARLGLRVTCLGLVSPMGPVAEYVALRRTGRLGANAARVSAGHRIFFLGLPKRKRVLKAQSVIGARAFKAAPRVFARLFAMSLSEADGEVLAQPHVQESLIRMTQEALRQGVSGGLADLAIFSQPWSLDYGEISAPSIVWQGTSDRIVPAAVSYWLAQQLPQVRLNKLEGAGHFWVYDHVGDVLHDIREAAVGV